MAKSKKVTPQVDATDKNANLDNGQVDSVDTANTTPVETTPAVDSAKDANKALTGKMKAIGLDSKGLYTAWDNGALDSEGNNGAIDMIDFMVMKHKLTADDKTAILAMFAAMAKANAPKVKVAHVCPVDVASDYAVAWGIRQQMLAQYNAAKKAVDVLYCAILDETKLDLDEAKTAVVKAGFNVNAKNGTIATAKGKTDGEHGNAGTSRVQTGCTITVGDTSYNGWKDLAKNLVTSVFKGDDASCNYPVNTKILEKLVEMDLPVTVHITPTLVNGTKDAALDAWNKSALCAKLGEYPSIVVNVK